jgi:hypothetical protein
MNYQFCRPFYRLVKPISMTWAAIFPWATSSSCYALPFLTVLGSLSAFLLWKNGVGVSALKIYVIA